MQFTLAENMLIYQILAMIVEVDHSFPMERHLL